MYDMSFKYFLGMSPEEGVINPSTLTKFRKLRLKDIDLLDMLISKTVSIAIEKGIIKSNTIIVWRYSLRLSFESLYSYTDIETSLKTIT